MTDHTDHSDAEPTGEEYEPPRAVYLSAIATGAGDCTPGSGVSGRSCLGTGEQAYDRCSQGDTLFVDCSTSGSNGATFGPRRRHFIHVSG